MFLRKLVIILIVILSASSFVHAKSWGKKNEAKQPQVQAPAEPAQPAPAVQVPSTPAVSSITQSAVSSGVLNCVSRINQVSTHLTKNTKSGAYLFLQKTQPDQHIFSASLEMSYSPTSTIYASANFTPTPLGGCDAVYDTVEYMPDACPKVVALHFKGGKPPVIERNIMVLDTGTVKFFLMPAGSGCVVIKKEIVQ